jgi:hypothetical protein
MDSFAAYGSDEGSDGEPSAAEGAPSEPLVAATASFCPAWQEDEDDDGSEEERRKDSGETARNDGTRIVEASEAAEAPQPKKRKLINPFAAMQEGRKASFLSTGAKGEDPEFFTSSPSVPAASAPAQRTHVATEGAAGGSITAAPAPEHKGAAASAAASQKKKEETTRQKNARKQKLGQANFTVKSNRECPDIWQGS